MKRRKFKNKKNFSGSILSVCVCLLMGLFAFTHIGCSSDKDEEIEVYRVTFDTDGGAPVPAIQQVEAGKMVSVPATNPTKAGYVFLFWHLSGATTAYNFQNPVTSDMTLYAKWEDEALTEYWQVTWNLDNGTWPSDDNHATQVVKGGTLAEPKAPVKSGYTFEGWYKEPALTNKVTFPYDVSQVTSDITLYAKWITDNTPDPSGYEMFTSISGLRSWLASQPDNTVETAYKVGLKNVNLDSGNNWGDLGKMIGQTYTNKYIELNLLECASTAVPDGYKERVGLTYYFYGVFLNCKNLVGMILPKNIKTVGVYAFWKCENLKSVIFPEGLTEIHQEAFRDCLVLSSVVLPETLVSIDLEAFRNCNEIRSIAFPRSLKNIGQSAFQSCGLETLFIPATLTNWEGASFFDNNLYLTTVVMEEGLEVIGSGLFSGCRKLESVTLPQSLTSIPQNTFKDCKALTKLEIPAKVSSIGSSAFYNAFPSGSTIIMHPAVPPTLGYRPFEYAGVVSIQVPAASVNAYKTAWKEYASLIMAKTD